MPEKRCFINSKNCVEKVNENIVKETILNPNMWSLILWLSENREEALKVMNICRINRKTWNFFPKKTRIIWNLCEIKVKA